MKKSRILIIALTAIILLIPVVFILKDKNKYPSEMQITSPAFEYNERIPEKFTCDGDNFNPTLEIEDVPEDAQSLVLIVDDPDAPMGTWVHWVVFNIPPETGFIAENSVPGTLGINDFKKLDYGGPCPPSGTHRYFFRVYALDIKLNLAEGATKSDVERHMKGHVLDEAELMGTYSRG